VEYCEKNTSLEGKKTKTKKEKIKTVIINFGESLEDLIFQICENAGLQSADILSELNYIHNKKTIENYQNYGIDVFSKKIRDIDELEIYEPFDLKKNFICSGTELVSYILLIDFNINMPLDETDEERSERMSKELIEKKRVENNWKEFVKNKRIE
jgi:T-complex protein 1 subunit eta